LLCGEWLNQSHILHLIPTIFKFMSFTFMYFFFIKQKPNQTSF
jgi:hypothetical protein